MLPALVLPFLMETVTAGFRARSLRNAQRVLGRWQHWLSVAVIAVLLLYITPRLIDWHPTDTVSGEIVSAALRLPLVYLLDLFLVLFLLAIAGTLLSRGDTSGNAVTEPPPDRVQPVRGNVVVDE